MKVAVLIDTWFPFVGGGQINAWEISKGLARRGNKVEIITRNCGTDHLKPFKNLNIIKLGNLSKPGDDMARIRYLWQALIYINRNHFDLVMAHAFLPGLIIKIFMILKKKPAILVVHGTSIGTELNKGPKALLEKFILTKIKYSAEITVSRDFPKIKNVNSNIIYIPNGIDPIFFKNYRPVKRIKDSLLFIGRLHPQKNLTNLIEAIKILKDENFIIKLIIIGEGPEKQKILDLVAKYRLKDLITLVGVKHGQDLIKYYKSTSAFILPSIYEGQALTLLEAWASKTPVIATKTGDHRYLVKEGVNGYFIRDYDDPKSIAQAIKKALNDKNLTTKGQNGYRLAKDNFSWDSTIQKILQIIKTINP